jgi:hypothetical protein
VVPYDLSDAVQTASYGTGHAKVRKGRYLSEVCTNDIKSCGTWRYHVGCSQKSSTEEPHLMGHRGMHICWSEGCHGGAMTALKSVS